MAFFGMFKINVFSDVSGVVTKNGKPVEGAVVSQWAKLNFNKNEFVNETKTDSDGRFSFNAIYTNTVNRFLPSANTVTQEIKINYQGKTYRAWVSVKDNYDYDGELNNIKKLIGERDQMKVFPTKIQDAAIREKIIPFHLQCELTREESIKTNDHAAVQGICEWPGLQ